jgi:predicted porin
MKMLIATLACMLALPAQADDLFAKIDPAPMRELWIDTGFATWHFDSDKDLNGSNPGVGLEYRFNGATAVTAGRFFNSDRVHSRYAGVIWQPYALGPVRLGVVAAAFDGYPKMRGGGWFAALIPVATVEFEDFGLNVGVIPSYKNRLYGGVSLQLKFRLLQ